MAARPLPPPWRWWPIYVLVAAGAVVAVVAALRAIGDVLSPVREALFVVLFGIVVAFLLAPVVERIERVVHRRSLAIVIAVLGVLLAVGIFVGLTANALVREARDLITVAPQYIEELRSDRPLSIAGVEIPGEIRAQAGALLAERGNELFETSARIALGVLGAVVGVALVFVLAVYLLADAKRIRSWMIGWVPRRHRDLAEDIEDDLAHVFGRYVRAQLVLATIIGLASIAAYSLLGLRQGLLLGTLAGVLALVPIVGPILAGTIAAAMALFQPWPLVVWVVLAAILIQQLESNLLAPRLSGAAVRISPVAVILAVLFAIQAAGIMGGIFAVPITGMLARFAERLREPAREFAESARAAERAETVVKP